MDIEVERSWVAGAFARFGAQGHLCDKSVALPSENIESALPDSLHIGLARVIKDGCDCPRGFLIAALALHQHLSASLFPPHRRMTDGNLALLSDSEGHRSLSPTPLDLSQSTLTSLRRSSNLDEVFVIRDRAKLPVPDRSILLFQRHLVRDCDSRTSLTLFVRP